MSSCSKVMIINVARAGRESYRSPSPLF